MNAPSNQPKNQTFIVHAGFQRPSLFIPLQVHSANNMLVKCRAFIFMWFNILVLGFHFTAIPFITTIFCDSPNPSEPEYSALLSTSPQSCSKPPSFKLYVLVQSTSVQVYVSIVFSSSNIRGLPTIACLPRFPTSPPARSQYSVLISVRTRTRFGVDVRITIGAKWGGYWGAHGTKISFGRFWCRWTMRRPRLVPSA